MIVQIIFWIHKPKLVDYPATQQGQLDYLLELKQVLQIWWSGLVYWEPAWVSTTCSTLWGNGSHWDNATLFDHEFKATKGLEFIVIIIKKPHK